MPESSKASVRTAPTHAPFRDLVLNAVRGLKERSGSSLYAIRKKVADENTSLTGTWEKSVSRAIKQLSEQGVLVRNKASFKLAQTARKLQGPTPGKKVRIIVYILDLGLTRLTTPFSFHGHNGFRNYPRRTHP